MDVRGTSPLCDIAISYCIGAPQGVEFIPDKVGETSSTSQKKLRGRPCPSLHYQHNGNLSGSLMCGREVEPSGRIIVSLSFISFEPAVVHSLVLAVKSIHKKH